MGKRMAGLSIPDALVAICAEAGPHCNPGTFLWHGRNWSAADFLVLYIRIGFGFAGLALVWLGFCFVAGFFLPPPTSELDFHVAWFGAKNDKYPLQPSPSSPSTTSM